MASAPPLRHIIGRCEQPHALNYQEKYGFLKNPFRL